MVLLLLRLDVHDAQYRLALEHPAHLVRVDAGAHPAPALLLVRAAVPRERVPERRAELLHERLARESRRARHRRVLLLARAGRGAHARRCRGRGVRARHALARQRARRRRARVLRREERRAEARRQAGQRRVRLLRRALRLLLLPHVLLRGHLRPELHAVRVERLERERVHLREGVEARRGDAALADAGADAGEHVERRVEVLLQPRVIAVGGRRLAGQRRGRERARRGELGDERRVHGREGHRRRAAGPERARVARARVQSRARGQVLERVRHRARRALAALLVFRRRVAAVGQGESGGDGGERRGRRQDGRVFGAAGEKRLLERVDFVAQGAVLVLGAAEL
jgi:hypothetical protein